MEMTTAQLREWANTATFAAADHIDGETEFEIPAGGYTEDGETIMKSVVCASAWRTLTATLPDGTQAEITYQEEIEWNTSYAGRVDDEYKTSPMSEADTWVADGITLLGDDGDVITGRDAQDYFKEAFGSDSIANATAINYADLLPTVATEDIDINEDSDMEIITVQRDNDADLRFNGEEIASASSKQTYNDGGRWTVLKLFKTASGKFVCQSIGRTQWQGETDRYSAAIAEDDAGVIAFFKHGRLAKDLYSEAGIDDVQEVE